jgi:hypothetical protein
MMHVRRAWGPSADADDAADNAADDADAAEGGAPSQRRSKGKYGCPLSSCPADAAGWAAAAHAAAAWPPCLAWRRWMATVGGASRKRACTWAMCVALALVLALAGTGVVLVARGLPSAVVPSPEVEPLACQQKRFPRTPSWIGPRPLANHEASKPTSFDCAPFSRPCAPFLWPDLSVTAHSCF